MIGQETEYAIRFSGPAKQPRPSNEILFEAIKSGIERTVKTCPGARQYNEQFFTQNGGVFCYEYLPYAIDGGLFEAGTPECSGPSEFLLYQRAQEELLKEALEKANLEMNLNGFAGELALIKNCRDIEGNIYGAQENYETDIALNAKDLWGHRLGNIILFPFGALSLVYYIVVSLALLLSLACALLVLFLLCLVPLTIGLLIGPLARSFKFMAHLKFFLEFPFNKVVKSFSAGDQIVKGIGKLDYFISYPIWAYFITPLFGVHRLFAFKKQREGLLPFLVSRIIFSGAGTLEKDGGFLLSEKATGIRSVLRHNALPSNRSIFDSGNICKDFYISIMELFKGNFRDFKKVLKSRQRLQLGLSESNRMDLAEYLKMGTTVLALEMIEKGFICNQELPHLKKPVRALHQINQDPGLKIKVLTKSGDKLSALEIQKWYLSKAKDYLSQAPSVPMEYHEIVKKWGEVLNLLEASPEKLIGRIDWVTKRYFIEQGGDGPDYYAKKKIDIGYGEIGPYAYLNSFLDSGLALKLLSEEKISEAVYEPPSPKSAQRRAQAIKNVEFEGRPVKISWTSVKVGSWFNKKIIILRADE